VASVEDGLAAIAAGLRADEANIARTLTRDIVPVMPDMGAEGERQILSSCAANLRVVAAVLERPLAPPPAPPAETMSYLRMLVHRSLDVDSMLHGYRVGHAALWRCCAREAFARVEDPVLLPAVLEEASDIVFRYMNAAMQRVAEEFQVERHAHMRWPIARKLTAVIELLRGDADPDLDELGTVLGYDVTRRHAGFVVHVGTRPGGGEPDGRPRAEVVAVRIARLVADGTRPLVLPTGGETAWMWLGADVDLDGPALQVVEGLIAEAGATVGMGEPADGVAGFGETHRQAHEALDSALAADRRFARYGDVALLSVLGADAPRALRMMRWYLGALDDDSQGAVRLRDTLRVLLETNLNQRETARRLGMHAHTIGYRLRQIEEILGHPIGDRAVELRAALIVRDALRADGR
jgi:hypothetical protein